jgi:hypothetical protein
VVLPLLFETKEEFIPFSLRGVNSTIGLTKKTSFLL